VSTKSDDYLRSIKNIYNSTANPLLIRLALDPIISKWASGYLNSINQSGSFAKGTAVKGGSDFDIFVSMKSTLTHLTLEEIFNSLKSTLDKTRFQATTQNVSLGVTVGAWHVDIVPGRQQSPTSDYHSLYKARQNTWTQSNIQLHIDTVVNSNCIDEIKLTKIWRNLRKLDFPSFYLELVVIEALSYTRLTSLADKFFMVLKYLANSFVTATFVDPSNTNNIISDDLTVLQKNAIADEASLSLGQTTWQNIVW
jgi:predicted nucleotidyltransferase